MTNKVNDTNLVERIRSIQKSEKANRKCANCCESGPVYICVDYQTFVCIECSGLHRELGHKVKSISMSDWTKGEVDAIEFSGGNVRDREVFLAAFDSAVFPRPTSQDRDKLRRFIRMKYIDRRWAGSASIPLSPARSESKSSEKKKKKKKESIGSSNVWDVDGILNSPPRLPEVDSPGIVQPETSSIETNFSDAIRGLSDLMKTDPKSAIEMGMRVVSRIQDCMKIPEAATAAMTRSSNPFDEPYQQTVMGFPIMASSPQRPAATLLQDCSIPDSVISPPKSLISSNPFDSFS